MQLHKDDPFAIVGINTDKDKDDYRKQYEEFGMTWNSIFDGSTKGPVSTAWGVSYFPTVYVLDAKGVIRGKDLRGEALDAMVAKLLAEMKAAEPEPAAR